MPEFQEKRSIRKDLLNKKVYIALVISTILCSLTFILIYGLNEWGIRALVDGLFVAGALGIVLASFSLLTYFGFFDTVAVGTANLIGVLRKEGQKKYASLFDYKELKKEKRKSNRFVYLGYLLPGIIYIILFTIFYLINY